jgi:hypothetical protein
MTVELDNIVKNLKGSSLTIELEQDGDETEMYISTEFSSGAGYTVRSVQDIGEFVQHYLLNYYTD